MVGIAILAILLVSPVSFGPGGESSPAPHNCRFWGAIGDRLDSDFLVDQLISQPQSLENLSSSNQHGWGLIYFAGESTAPTIHRGLHAAYEDPLYEVSVQHAGDDSSRIVIGHVRNCTSGLCDIPNPHPFHRFKNGRHWFMGHNGSIDKEVLLDLIRPDYLASNPPENGEGVDEWIDSELYFLYILQSLEDHDWQLGPALGEVVQWLRLKTPGDIEQLNFVMTDGQTLWAYREGISLYYRYEPGLSGFGAVASKYPGAEQGPWTEMMDGQFLTLRRDGPPLLRHVEDYFTTTGAGESPSAGPALSAWPNPFNPVTTLGLELPEAGRYRLAVYDLSGRRRALLSEGEMSAGEHRWTWRARDGSGHPLAGGVYFLRLSGEGGEAASKLILLR